MELSGDPNDSWWCGLKCFLGNKFSVRQNINHVKAIVRNFGLVIGIIVVLFEVTEHFVLPAVLISTTGSPEWIIAGTIPVGECVFYPILFKFFGGKVDNFHENNGN